MVWPLPVEESEMGQVDRQAALLGGEVRFYQLWNWVIQRGLSAWGIQIRLFAAG